MEDKGKKLYEMYLENMSQQGIGLDEWHDLEEYDRVAWRETADQVLKGEL